MNHVLVIKLHKGIAIQRAQENRHQHLINSFVQEEQNETSFTELAENL